MTNQMVVDAQSSSASSGIYITNCLFKRFKSEADLHPIDGEPCPLAIPTHAHEFVHYLHNISTTSGVRATLLGNIVVSLAAQFLIEPGCGVTVSGKNSSQSDNIQYFIGELNFIYGDVKEECGPSGSEGIGWSFSELRRHSFNKLNFYEIVVLHNIKGCIKKFSLKIGLNFITEGVAYEVEREIWLEKGVSRDAVDARTPPFPYLAYEPLVNFLTGRLTTPLERIKIGNAALLHISPSQGFVDACKALGENQETFDCYSLNVADRFRSFIENDFLKLVDELKKFYKNTDKLLPAFCRYVSIIKNASSKRIVDANIELKLLGVNISPEIFLNISSSIAQHCIFQEKQDNSVQIDVVCNVSDELSDDELKWFNVLCAAIHFVQQHLTKSGDILETDRLQEKQCPFTGGCEVERSEGNPESCRKSPWRFQPRTINGTCWYLAGVQSITPRKISHSHG